MQLGEKWFLDATNEIFDSSKIINSVGRCWAGLVEFIQDNIIEFRWWLICG